MTTARNELRRYPKRTQPNTSSTSSLARYRRVGCRHQLTRRGRSLNACLNAGLDLGNFARDAHFVQNLVRASFDRRLDKRRARTGAVLRRLACRRTSRRLCRRCSRDGTLGLEARGARVRRIRRRRWEDQVQHATELWLTILRSKTSIDLCSSSCSRLLDWNRLGGLAPRTEPPNANQNVACKLFLSENRELLEVSFY